MNTLAIAPLSMNADAAASLRPSRATGVLHSLMNLYEQGEGLEDNQESETELMVLLSGMVAVDLNALHGE
jgi:hypothetical protein